MEAPRATQWTSAVLVIIFQGHRCILRAPRLNYQLWACQPQMFQLSEGFSSQYQPFRTTMQDGGSQSWLHTRTTWE